MKAGHREMTKLKRRKEPTGVRSRGSSMADLQEQLDRRTRELNEALDHQTAASAVLSVIGRSPADAQPVFDAIVQNAARLCQTVFSVVYLYDGDRLRMAAANNYTSDALRRAQALARQPERSHLAGRAVLDRAIVHVQDVLADPDYSRELALAGGWRAVLSVPLLRDGKPLGAISVAKAEAVPFSNRQNQLLNTFADQAVIAIENVRLFDEVQARTRELSEALDQQMAMSGVLRVISSSPMDLAPVFDTILTNATRLCEGNFALLCRYDGGVLVGEATCHGTPEFTEEFMGLRFTPGREGPTRLAALERRTVHVTDMTVEPGFSPMVLQYERARTVLAVPLLRETNLVGVITIWRREVRPFTEQHIALVQTFADQAAIAIENTRLLNELRESLQQQTATSEVLGVISSSP